VFAVQLRWLPVADTRVRQALNLAIDKEAIMKFVFAGQGVPAPMYPIGSYGVAGGADASLQPYPYDPQRAKQLLAEAGYPPRLRHQDLIICHSGLARAESAVRGGARLLGERGGAG
jgi:ABC-type transport system substrate-binding protein